MNIPEQSINILIIDDEPKNLTVLETVLANPGYRLVRAASADDALLALVAEEFALLILDIRMPGMSGFELAQMIKERKKTARVPIIFLTAYYNEDQHVLAGYDSGAVDYLHKPVDASILRSKVAVFAELHRKSRELKTANHNLLAEVSERRLAEERLRELNETLEQRVAERTKTLEEIDRRKDEFLAMLSHELRAPLAPIVNALQLLALQHGSETPIQQKARGIIGRQMGRLQHLVDDLLEVSRITTSTLQVCREPVAVSDIVEAAVESARPLIEQRRHELVVSLPPEPIWLHADATRLEQVLVNLLTNAAKYTEEGGHVWLSVELSVESARGSPPAPPQVVIRVRDSGAGIDRALLPRIFELFTQAERSLDRSQGGLGVGLALVRRLMELHGGTVEVVSELGQGSEFVVRLPVLPMEAPQSALPVTETSQPSVRPLRVLVVDDDVDTALTFAMLLRALGHDVRVAHDGTTAVQAALDYHPDLAILDIGLPGLNGYQVAKRIRQEPLLESLMLIAVTGYGRDSDRKTSLEAGFNHHLVKPAGLEQVQQILATIPHV